MLSMDIEGIPPTILEYTERAREEKFDRIDSIFQNIFLSIQDTETVRTIFDKKNYYTVRTTQKRDPLGNIVQQVDFEYINPSYAKTHIVITKKNSEPIEITREIEDQNISLQKETHLSSTYESEGYNDKARILEDEHTFLDVGIDLICQLQDSIELKKTEKIQRMAQLSSTFDNIFTKIPKDTEFNKRMTLLSRDCVVSAKNATAKNENERDTQGIAISYYGANGLINNILALKFSNKLLIKFSKKNRGENPIPVVERIIDDSKTEINSDDIIILKIATKALSGIEKYIQEKHEHGRYRRLHILFENKKIK